MHDTLSFLDAAEALLPPPGPGAWWPVATACHRHLRAARRPDGSWGSVDETAWAVRALIGRDEVRGGIAYLSGAVPGTCRASAARLHALKLAAAAGLGDHGVEEARLELLGRRGSHGGWPAHPPGDRVTTARVVQALGEADDGALAYLARSADTDVEGHSEVVLAALAAGIDPGSTWVRGLVHALRALQHRSGGFVGAESATARAIVALDRVGCLGAAERGRAWLAGAILAHLSGRPPVRLLAQTTLALVRGGDAAPR